MPLDRRAQKALAVVDARTSLANSNGRRHHGHVNLLLLEPAEIAPDGTVSLRDRRAEHLRSVLQATKGRILEAGVLNGPIGQAEVLSVDAESVTLRANCQDPAPIARDVLLLAVPRPKVLLRMLELAASLGFCEIVLFRSWRVDKSHLGSQALDPAVQDLHLRLGLEQARRTQLPRIKTFLLFRPFVEDHLPHLDLPAHRFCAHPFAAVATRDLALTANAPIALCIGPEGGFLPWEVDQLARSGLLPVRMSHHPLRTEAALAAMHAQLDLMRDRQ